MRIRVSREAGGTPLVCAGSDWGSADKCCHACIVSLFTRWHPAGASSNACNALMGLGSEVKASELLPHIRNYCFEGQTRSSWPLLPPPAPVERERERAVPMSPCTIFGRLHCSPDSSQPMPMRSPATRDRAVCRVDAQHRPTSIQKPSSVKPPAAHPPAPQASSLFFPPAPRACSRAAIPRHIGAAFLGVGSACRSSPRQRFGLESGRGRDMSFRARPDSRQHISAWAHERPGLLRAAPLPKSELDDSAGPPSEMISTKSLPDAMCFWCPSCFSCLSRTSTTAARC